MIVFAVKKNILGIQTSSIFHINFGYVTVLFLQYYQNVIISFNVVHDF